MKNKLLIAILIAAGFSSCTVSDDTNDYVNDGDGNTPISFDNRVVGASADTRALDKNNSNWAVNDDIIGIHAFYSVGTGFTTNFDDNYMANFKLVATTFSGGQTGPAIPNPDWALKGLDDLDANRYWSNDLLDKITFFAYFPWNTTAPVITTDKTITIPWTVVATATAQQDLMWASVINADKNHVNGAGKEATPGDATNFALKHALSKIKFTAKTAGDYTGTTTTITNVKIIGAGHVGTYTVANTLLTGEWSAATAVADVVAFNNTATGRTVTATSAPLQVQNEDIATQRDHELLLIPQTLGSVTISLTYAVTQGEGENATTSTDTKVFTLADSWVQNTQYTYNFVISMAGVDFTTTVGAWDEAGQELPSAKYAVGETYPKGAEGNAIEGVVFSIDGDGTTGSIYAMENATGTGDDNAPITTWACATTTNKAKDKDLFMPTNLCALYDFGNYPNGKNAMDGKAMCNYLSDYIDGGITDLTKYANTAIGNTTNPTINGAAIAVANPGETGGAVHTAADFPAYQACVITKNNRGTGTTFTELGADEWYLPAVGQLLTIYKSNSDVLTANCWSSTEGLDSPIGNFYFNYSVKNAYSSDRAVGCIVRCVRDF